MLEQERMSSKRTLQGNSMMIKRTVILMGIIVKQRIYAKIGKKLLVNVKFSFILFKRAIKSIQISKIMATKV
jgi:hypothetical protein